MEPQHAILGTPSTIDNSACALKTTSPEPEYMGPYCSHLQTIPIVPVLTWLFVGWHVFNKGLKGLHSRSRRL